MERNYKGFTFDDSEYPLVKVIADGEEMTLEDVRLSQLAFRSVLDANKGKFVVLVDARKGRWLGGEARVALGKGQKLIEEEYLERYQKQIIVVPNSIVKMMVKGVNLATKPIVSQVIFSKYEEAMDFINEEIAKF